MDSREGEPTPAPAADRRSTADSVLVVTGGARGVTAAALRALAATGRPRMVLLGRTALADEPEFLAPARDEPSLTRLLAERDAYRHAGRAGRARLAPSWPAGRSARRWPSSSGRGPGAVRRGRRHGPADARAASWPGYAGSGAPVTGLVHGAGVLADKRIAEKTDDQFDRVFDTKVAGLRRAARRHRRRSAGPAVPVLVGRGARTATPGSATTRWRTRSSTRWPHAEQRRRPACLVRAIGWGPWEAGMVTARAGRALPEPRRPADPAGRGARAFVAELSARRPTRPTCSSPPADALRIEAGGGSSPSATVQRRVRTPTWPTTRRPGCPWSRWPWRWNGSPPPGWRATGPLGRLPTSASCTGSRSRPGRPAVTAITVARARPEADLDCGPGSTIAAPSRRPGTAADAGRRRSAWSPSPRSAVYESAVLFHGPEFQVLRRVAGCRGRAPRRGSPACARPGLGGRPGGRPGRGRRRPAARAAVGRARPRRRDAAHGRRAVPRPPRRTGTRDHAVRRPRRDRRTTGRGATSRCSTRTARSAPNCSASARPPPRHGAGGRRVTDVRIRIRTDRDRRPRLRAARSAEPEQFWDNVASGRVDLDAVRPEDWRLPPGSLGAGADGRPRPGLHRGLRSGRVRRRRRRGRRIDPALQWVLHAGRAGAARGRRPRRPARTGLVMGNLSYPSRSLAAYAERVWLAGHPDLLAAIPEVTRPRRSAGPLLLGTVGAHGGARPRPGRRVARPRRRLRLRALRRSSSPATGCTTAPPT